MPRRFKKSRYRKKHPIKRLTVSKVKKIIHQKEVLSKESLKIQQNIHVTPAITQYRMTWWLKLDSPLGNTNASDVTSKYVNVNYTNFIPSTPAAIADARAYVGLLDGNKIYRQNLKVTVHMYGVYWTGAGPGGFTGPQMGMPLLTLGTSSIVPTDISFRKTQVRLTLVRAKRDTADSVIDEYLKTLPIDNNPGFFVPLNTSNLIVMYDKFFSMNDTTSAGLHVRIPIKKKAQRITKKFQTDSAGTLKNYWIDRSNIYLLVQVYENGTFTDKDSVVWHYLPITNVEIQEWFKD